MTKDLAFGRTKLRARVDRTIRRRFRNDSLRDERYLAELNVRFWRETPKHSHAVVLSTVGVAYHSTADTASDRADLPGVKPIDRDFHERVRGPSLP